MVDFIRIVPKESRKKDDPTVELIADYVVGRSEDLMVQGKAFYAVWDEQKGLWSRDEYDVALIVDQLLREKAEELKADGVLCVPKFLRDYDTGRWDKFQKFVKNVSDNSHPLDTKITFANTKVKKTDYASRRLPYNLGPGDISAYETLVSRLYEPEERKKFEWMIGAVIHGDAKKIQKFLVFFGGPGTGKSTIMEILTLLMGGKVKDGGYVTMFDAKALVGNNNAFATEAFKDNPLVAIQHDGDLSQIEDNTKLNSIVSHEDMRINEKYKATYDHKINAVLFMGTNKPVQITDAKSGLIRRLIDVNPTGKTFHPDEYFTLMGRIPFELGAIAHHCLQVYKTNGKNAYKDYEPTSMMLKTDVFYNFVQDHFDIFKDQDGTTLSIAWEMFKVYIDEAKLKYPINRNRFRESLKDYFEEFHDRAPFGGTVCRSVYTGFKESRYKTPVTSPGEETIGHMLVMEETTSILDEMYAGLPAQYSNSEGYPRYYWDGSERYDKKGNPFTPRESQIVSTVLGEIDTSKLHFLKVPEHHIIIDFDLKDADGNKSLELNMKAASSWPPTYAELSKSGNGVHLHYIWDGDPSDLASVYSDDIEIKVYTGNQSLRRKLTKCNNVAVATISSGLPFREKKHMLQTKTLKSEQGLRDLINKALRKEIHPAGTKPNIDFIEHILREAYKSGLTYDVSDMRQKVMLFANSSSNQAQLCLKIVARMEWKSEINAEEVPDTFKSEEALDGRYVFFDCEVYPNLFVICWKYHGSPSVVRMINPTPQEVDELRKYKLIGFNNRGYDNHIIYARILGASNEQLYQLSQKIIVDKDDNAKYGEAWGLSYADVYDFSVDKKTLKKWEIELGIPHVEMDIPWDQPVPEDKILKVVDYCCNDVNALEAVFDHCQADFQARQILANMSGLSVNSSTRQHAIRIMFGSERNPQSKFVYTDLSEMFPGYKFDEFAKVDKSWYQGEAVGEGGYVYAEPGIHENVALLDIASMHPTSIEELNLFGPYTAQFTKLKEARLAIKHGDFKKAQELLPGVQVDKDNAKAMSNALKLVINSIYGYTSAKFSNPFRDPRNKDNIVAKRGALFMIDLKRAVQEQGFTVAHIKTDSIKIPNATPDIIAFVSEFGARYGYTFEHEATYDKMCLVNDAVYIAKDKDGWHATGAQFQHPYVFKRLFTGEPVYFKDLCETKQVKKGAMYLKFDGVEKEIGDHKEGAIPENELAKADPEYGDVHIGRSGMFVPINPDQSIFQGGELVCRRDDLKKDHSVAGTKGYLWAEAEMIQALNDREIERMIFERVEDAVEGTGSIADVIDMTYYEALANDAIETIDRFGDFEKFVA